MHRRFGKKKSALLLVESNINKKKVKLKITFNTSVLCSPSLKLQLSEEWMFRTPSLTSACAFDHLFIVRFLKKIVIN